MEGPWGGGNMFAKALSTGLQHRGAVVRFDLKDPDIDIVILTDFRSRNPACAFGPGAVLRYLWLRNPRAVVVHRVNECDARKKTHHVDRTLVRANYCADETVFVGSWLTELPAWRAARRTPFHVILNGADSTLFHARGHAPWDGRSPLRIVTHHWGGNLMKGFDVYETIDRLLADPAWRERLEFTYVGNLPDGFEFRHGRYVPPLSGEALAAELRSHHVYVTASLNEPGGNHQNEGALCGLPLLYRNSGCMPEYCSGYGEMFNGPDDIAAALDRLVEAYPRYRDAMPRYPWTGARMVDAWSGLLERLMQQRDIIASRRRLWRDPALFLRNLLPV
jgi:hypothetical protein